MSLDSIYAIVARPPRQVDGVKRKVNKVGNSDSIAADSHEDPQSQLPADNPSVKKQSAKAQLAREQSIQEHPTHEQSAQDADSPYIKHIDIEV